MGERRVPQHVLISAFGNIANPQRMLTPQEIKLRDHNLKVKETRALRLKMQEQRQMELAALAKKQEELEQKEQEQKRKETEEQEEMERQKQKEEEAKELAKETQRKMLELEEEQKMLEQEVKRQEDELKAMELQKKREAELQEATELLISTKIKEIQAEHSVEMQRHESIFQEIRAELAKEQSLRITAETQSVTLQEKCMQLLTHIDEMQKKAAMEEEKARIAAEEEKERANIANADKFASFDNSFDSSSSSSSSNTKAYSSSYNEEKEILDRNARIAKTTALKSAFIQFNLAARTLETFNNIVGKPVKLDGLVPRIQAALEGGVFTDNLDTLCTQEWAKEILCNPFYGLFTSFASEFLAVHLKNTEEFEKHGVYGVRAEVLKKQKEQKQQEDEIKQKIEAAIATAKAQARAEMEQLQQQQQQRQQSSSKEQEDLFFKKQQEQMLKQQYEQLVQQQEKFMQQQQQQQEKLLKQQQEQQEMIIKQQQEIITKQQQDLKHQQEQWLLNQQQEQAMKQQQQEQAIKQQQQELLWKYQHQQQQEQYIKQQHDFKHAGKNDEKFDFKNENGESSLLNSDGNEYMSSLMTNKRYSSNGSNSGMTRHVRRRAPAPYQRQGIVNNNNNSNINNNPNIATLNPGNERSVHSPTAQTYEGDEKTMEHALSKEQQQELTEMFNHFHLEQTPTVVDAETGISRPSFVSPHSRMNLNFAEKINEFTPLISDCLQSVALKTASYGELTPFQSIKF